MNISIYQPNELTPEMIESWKKFQHLSPDLTSPFYSPEFTQLISRHRNDVEVAVVNEDSLRAFFPYQRGKWNTGRPVGAKLNDFQGVIHAPNQPVDLFHLVRCCNLSLWSFDHLPVTRISKLHKNQMIAHSPYISLANGYDGYLAEKKRAKSKTQQSYLRKSRKLAREIGELRFVFHSSDTDVFDQLLKWKSEHLRRIQASNVFENQWAYRVAQELPSIQDDEFKGTLSSLYAGDQLIAAHLGLRNSNTLHWWVTSYNPEFHQYSPGMILLSELIRASAEQGIRKIDLGKGNEAYKLTFQTGAVALCEGAVATTTWQQAYYGAFGRLRKFVRTSPLDGFVKVLKNRFKRVGRTIKPVSFGSSQATDDGIVS